MKRTISTALTGLIAATTLSSCLTPGQYLIYRVAYSEAQASEGCYGGNIPENLVDDSTTFKTGGTFAIYAAESDVFYLELEDNSIEGDKKGTNEYEFDGESVDVEPSMDNTVTTTRRLNIKLEKNGRRVKGKSVDETNVTCSGDNCNDPSNCVLTLEFEGAEIQGVDLEHSV